MTNTTHNETTNAMSGTPFFEIKLVTFKQARELLSCSERHLRYLIESGDIKPVWIGKGEKGKRIRVASLIRFINEREAS
jgi:hypothetical protein